MLRLADSKINFKRENELDLLSNIEIEKRGF
jgi:hypothetical protein